MPLFKLGQFNGSVPKLLHWFQCVPQFPSSCSYSLLFPFLICTFSIQLLSLVQLLLSSGPLCMNYGSHLFLLHCLFPQTIGHSAFLLWCSEVKIHQKWRHSCLLLDTVRRMNHLHTLLVCKVSIYQVQAVSQSSAKKFVWHSWGQKKSALNWLLFSFSSLSIPYLQLFDMANHTERSVRCLLADGLAPKQTN